MVLIRLLTLLLLTMSSAWAAQIVEFSPQDRVAVVNSVKVVFDVPVIALGDDLAPAPVTLTCDDPAVAGQGRWVDASHWNYVFTTGPGPGTQCTAVVVPSFRALDGTALLGRSRFTFETGGPRVVWHRPYGPAIEEEQLFVLRFNAVVTAQSVLDHTWCLVEGLGEVIPVRLITGEARDRILDITAAESERDGATLVVQCKRRLPPDAKVRLSVEARVASSSDVATDGPERFDYQVRPPFAASFSCQREHANMPCIPILPIAVQFNAPVAAADAQKIRLKTPTGVQSPSADGVGPYFDSVERVVFDGPFPPDAEFTLTLPDGLTDDSGRVLVNADAFPLTARTASYPPLVKFAAAPFGVIERFAGQPADGSEDEYPVSMPLTVRNVEAHLNAGDLPVSAGTVRDYVVADDAAILRWYARLGRLNDSQWSQAQLDAIMADRVIPERIATETGIDSRSFSVLKAQAGVKNIIIPATTDSNPRPFEVVGVPLQEPGFHVLEAESARLGQSLLASPASMYVRTSALVTNLGVHLKRGRDDTLAWVTTLDEGKVVPNAAIAVLSCSGELLASGETDQYGVWHDRHPLESPDYCDDTGLNGIYVSARIPATHPLARNKPDFAFVFSDWNQGIESWRFNVPTDTSPTPTAIAHTVFDRTLFRAGETVSMKHFIRAESREGLVVPRDNSRLPGHVVIEHYGSGERHELALEWVPTPSGGLSASSRFTLSGAATLGTYSVSLENDNKDWFGTSEFRVEEFKLPILTGKLKIGNEDGTSTLVAPLSLHADVQIEYVSGGPAGKLPVSVSGVVRDKWLEFAGYDEYSFMDDDASNEKETGDLADGDAQSLFLNKKPLTLDARGGGRLQVDSVPAVTRPRDLLFEASFADPNGEIQTLAQIVPVWPAAVIAGIRTERWITVGQPTRVSVVALSASAEPQANVPVVVSAENRTTFSSRKRLVGGFYSYDNHTETSDLGTLCTGVTNAQGRLDCSVDLGRSGSIRLRASVTDTQGRSSTATTTLWVMGDADLWFGGGNDDRIDIIAEKKAYQPGETAEFQVRMPFRQATALVAVEREGVLATQIVTLSGADPRIRVPVLPEWGPNVYVSVLVLRGRFRPVPWHSFFAWGWQQPTAWYGAWKRAARNYVAPTAFIDLSKPAFRFGLTEIQVSDNQDQLMVNVGTDKSTYQVRDTAMVTVRVNLPDGKPAAHGQIAFAAVDQALLELSSNPTWDVLAAMRRHRSYGVETATAQMQIVGRRHYGRKALPAGGGGGMSPTRELLDTLLLWQPVVQLDQDGKARISVPLNDSITRFKFVAIADYGANRFGTGSADIAVAQDLQIIAGLPPTVREGDHYQAAVTVRNSTAREMQIELDAGYTGAGVPSMNLPTRSVHVAAGAAESVAWDIEAPQGSALERSSVLAWTLHGREQVVPDGARDQDVASDRVLVSQSLLPVFPVTAKQATLFAIDAAQPPVRLSLAAPPDALRDVDGHARGGLEVMVQSSLAGGLPGVKAWFDAYPYTCLEQLASKAIGLRSIAQWQAIMAQLPDYLDDDGLAGYFPGAAQGSEVLTAYLLTASNEAQALGLSFGLPAAARESMISGLLAFAQGKIVRYRPSPQKDLDVRKLLVLEALSREGRATPRMLGSMTIAPNRWPTSAVIDWLALLQRLPTMADRTARMAEARQIIKSRLAIHGTELTFASDVQSDGWWLMVSPEVNAAKLMLTVMAQPKWADDLPRLAQGLLAMQTKGAWRTTTANLMGSLALEKFARHFERAPLTGMTELRFESQSQPAIINWRDQREPSANNVQKMPEPVRIFQRWPDRPADTLVIDSHGSGQGWATVRALAAVPITTPVMAGYSVTRRITPVSQAVPDVWSRGDVLRVTIDIQSEAPAAWAVLTDPVPAGATILGSGLGRDSAIAVSGESDEGTRNVPTFVERGFDSYRAYYGYLSQGRTRVQYTVRLNTVGQFQLPPTRIESLYQPDVYGEFPNTDSFRVEALK